MKRRLITVVSLLVVGIFLLSGCARLSPEGPAEVHINGKTYKTGFYGPLYVIDYTLENEQVKSKDITLRRIYHEQFKLYQADVGSYENGTVYCEESLYDEVAAFYSDPENYSYYCVLGVDSLVGKKTKTVELSGVDTEKFDALLNFLQESSYDPFDNSHNKKVKKVDLPMPDNKTETPLRFYKESKDLLFTSSKSYECYIFNNVLYSVYQYNYANGDKENERLIAVKAPEEISKYFIDFMSDYINAYNSYENKPNT